MKKFDLKLAFRGAGDNYVFEVKWDVPKDAPKSDRYGWFIHDQYGTRKLSFKSMEGSMRTFECGTTVDVLSQWTAEVKGSTQMVAYLTKGIPASVTANIQ